MKPLCAICGDRSASTLTDCESWTGAVREVPACWICVAPVPEPPPVIEEGDELSLSARAHCPTDHTTRDALLGKIRSCGGEATTSELLAMLGFGTHSKGADAIRASLRRMVRSCLVVCEELSPGKRSAGLRYRLVRS